MALVNGKARLVVMQFYCKLALIPDCIRQQEQKSAPVPFVQTKGQKFLERVEGVGCEDFLNDLIRVAYVLVDASVKPVGTQQALTKFIFADKDHANNCEEFEELRPKVQTALHILLRDAMWSPEGYVNPLFDKGMEVPGQCSVLIKLDNRCPLVDADGKPLLRWKKDERGNRIGEKPLAVKPDKFLRITGDDICVA